MFVDKSKQALRKKTTQNLLQQQILLKHFHAPLCILLCHVVSPYLSSCGMETNKTLILPQNSFKIESENVWDMENKLIEREIKSGEFFCF